MSANDTIRFLLGDFFLVAGSNMQQKNNSETTVNERISVFLWFVSEQTFTRSVKARFAGDFWAAFATI